MPYKRFEEAYELNRNFQTPPPPPRRPVYQPRSYDPNSHMYSEPIMESFSSESSHPALETLSPPPSKSPRNVFALPPPVRILPESSQDNTSSPNNTSSPVCTTCKMHPKLNLYLLGFALFIIVLLCIVLAYSSSKRPSFMSYAPPPSW